MQQTPNRQANMRFTERVFIQWLVITIMIVTGQTAKAAVAQGTSVSQPIIYNKISTGMLKSYWLIVSKSFSTIQPRLIMTSILKN